MDNLTRTNTGGRKSIPDYRDSVYASLAVLTTQPNIQTNFSLFPVYNQQQTPSCVSHSVVKLMQLYWYLKTGKIVTFNPQFLHILSVFPGATPEDGRDPRTVLQMAQKYGCCTSTTLPINTGVSNTQYCDPNVITQEMRDEAIQYAIPSFIQISLTENDFRNAIKNYGAISSLFEVGNTFWTAPDGKITWNQSLIDPIRATSNITSAHEVTIIGDNNSDLGQGVNSWGDTWDNKGYFSYIFNEWQPYITEAWAITDPDPRALALVQSLPQASQFKHNFQTTIKYGMSNAEVRALQIALAIDGDFEYPEITGTYGLATATAVLQFQMKYAVASLSELDSLHGFNSQVGPATRVKLNQLFNK